jgi:tetratricopeptide (TPR) repeat protein
MSKVSNSSESRSHTAAVCTSGTRPQGPYNRHPAYGEPCSQRSHELFSANNEISRKRWVRRIFAWGLRRARRLARSGRHSAALRVARRLAHLGPTVPVLQLYVAKNALYLGELDTARRALHSVGWNGQSTKLKYYCVTAKLFRELNDLDAVEECLEEARRIYPSSARTWALLGDLCRDRAKANDAERCFDTALTLASSLTERLMALDGLAGCFTDTARKDDAINVLSSIMEIEPDLGFNYWRLAFAQHDMTLSDIFITKIRSMLMSSNTGMRDRMHLHYALGMVLDRLQQYGDAFAHFLLANTIRSRRADPSQFDEKLIRKRCDDRISIFCKEKLRHLSQYGDKSDFLICIVGMPRSGTTLIEQILCSHSEVVGLGERMDFQLLTRHLQSRLRSRRPYPLCCSAMTPNDVRELSAAIREQLCQSIGPASHVVTKLPDDAWELGLIKILFPRAKIIHACRHPIDTCLSCFMQNFRQLGYTTNLRTLASVYRAYQRIMQHWKTVLGDEQIFDCVYEDFVSEPERVIHGLYNFCGLTYNCDWSTFWNCTRRVETASAWQVRNPIYNSSIHKWKNYAVFLGPLLELSADL